MQFWIEVLKLLVPFAVALTAIWVKEWYVTRNEKLVLMRLLSKELGTQLEMLPEIIQAFAKIPIRLKDEGFCIFVSQMTEWYFPTAARLAQLDHANAFVYSNFSSRAKHVEASSQNIQRMLNDAIGSSESKRVIYQSAVERNSRGLQQDFVMFAESCLLVLKALSAQISDMPRDVIPKAEASIGRAKDLLPHK